MSQVLIITLEADQLQQMISEAVRQGLEEKRLAQRLTRTEAAKYIQVGYKRMSTLMKTHKLEFGIDNRISVVDLEKFLEAG